MRKIRFWMIFFICVSIPHISLGQENKAIYENYKEGHDMLVDIWKKQNCMVALGIQEASKAKEEYDFIQILKDRINANPVDPIPHAFLAMTYNRLLMIFDARDEYKKAQELNTGDVFLCKQRLGPFVKFCLEQISRTIDDLEGKVGKLTSDSENEKKELALRAITKSEKFGDEWAIVYNIYAIYVLPDRKESARAYSNLGWLYALGGQQKLSASCFKKAISLNRELVEAYQGLSELYSMPVKRPEAVFEGWSLEDGKKYYQEAVKLLEQQKREEELKEFKTSYGVIFE